MASDTVLPVTAQQPIEGELNVLTMSTEQIVNLISATHFPDEENFDVGCLLVVVEKIFVRVSNVFYDREHLENVEEKDDREHLENVEEKVSRASFDPMIEQLSSEMMACEAPSVELIMSILNKLSNYSWEAKLVLILAAYALNYEDLLEIPNNVTATLKHQNSLNWLSFNVTIINWPLRCLRTMKYFLEVKKVTKDEPALLSDVAGDIPVSVYWIIVTCTTHMCCLTSDEDKTHALSPLVDKIWSGELSGRITRIYKMYTRRKLKELFASDAMQTLIDGSTVEQVSIDVLKKKNILLFISGLNIYKNDLSDLMSIYNGIKKKGDQYKIVWIPIVELWTNNLQRKFEMLQSKMPWYIVQYFSAVAGIKFIEERFDNKPIVVLMNPQGDVENEDALYLIQRYGMGAFPFTPRECEAEAAYRRTPGPYEIEEYTFLYGGKDKLWIEQFSQKVNVVAEDQLIQEANITIEMSCVGRDRRRQQDSDKEIQELLRSFKNERRWAVLMTDFSEVISKDGTTILQVLEAFEEWKVNVRDRSFQICFKEYHDRLLPTVSQPPASRNVWSYL